jgi:hypothetical protein
MTKSQQYVDELYYNRSCGQFLNEDVYFEKIFCSLDIEDAFEMGQMQPDRFTIERIFNLNKEYLQNCNDTKSVPNQEDRLTFIINNL